MRKFLFSALLLVTGASVAHSENLNLKFGPTWSCKMISAELDQRYQACLVCERQGKDFDFAFAPAATHAWSSDPDYARYLLNKLVTHFDRYLQPEE